MISKGGAETHWSFCTSFFMTEQIQGNAAYEVNAVHWLFHSRHDIMKAVD